MKQNRSFLQEVILNFSSRDKFRNMIAIPINEMKNCIIVPSLVWKLRKAILMQVKFFLDEACRINNNFIKED